MRFSTLLVGASATFVLATESPHSTTTAASMHTATRSAHAAHTTGHMHHGDMHLGDMHLGDMRLGNMHHGHMHHGHMHHILKHENGPTKPEKCCLCPNKEKHPEQAVKMQRIAWLDFGKDIGTLECCRCHKENKDGPKSGVVHSSGKHPHRRATRATSTSAAQTHPPHPSGTPTAHQPAKGKAGDEKHQLAVFPHHHAELFHVKLTPFCELAFKTDKHPGPAKHIKAAEGVKHVGAPGAATNVKKTGH